MRRWGMLWAIVFAVSGAIACTSINAPAAGVLYEKDSLFGRVTVKEDEAGFRSLHFGRDGARQSVLRPGDPEHLELPYARLAMAGLALASGVQRVLIIGLGGGTLPSFLRRHYPGAQIDVVDIDPEVINVAKRFFEFREDSRMRAHLADGRTFIESVRQPYDIVFLDAFGSDSVPERLTTVEFLRVVRNAVAPGGVVVGNVWGPYSNRLYNSMVRTYRETFDDFAVLDVKGAGNKILLALPRRQGLDRKQLLERVRQLSVAQTFRFDLVELVEFGYEREPEHPDTGTILRDRNLGRLE